MKAVLLVETVIAALAACLLGAGEFPFVILFKLLSNSETGSVISLRK